MKKYTILFFCMIFVNCTLSAQQNQLQANKGKDFIKSYFYSPVLHINGYVNKEVVSPDFYVNNLGFFCKQELKFQAVTKIPLKFRIGSVQYCDRMEGKINAGILPAN